MNLPEKPRGNRGTVLILFGAIALAGVIAILVIQASNSNKANEERARLKAATQVIGALGCERAERIAKKKDPRLGRELQATGFVTISPTCQDYVAILGQGLVYEDGKVRRQFAGEP